MKYYIEYLQEKNDEIEKEKIRQKYEKQRLELKKEKEKKKERIKRKAIDFSKDVGSNYWSDIKDSVIDVERKYFAKLASTIFKEKNELKALEKATKILKRGGVGVSATTMASLIIAGSYQAYRNYHNKAIMECKNLTGKKRKICMKIQRHKALKKRLEILNKETVNCDKAKHSDKCKAEIYRYSSKIKGKISDSLKGLSSDVLGYYIEK